MFEFLVADGMTQVVKTKGEDGRESKLDIALGIFVFC
jgi:hypothetical protein